MGRLMTNEEYNIALQEVYIRFKSGELTDEEAFKELDDIQISEAQPPTGFLKNAVLLQPNALSDFVMPLEWRDK